MTLFIRYVMLGANESRCLHDGTWSNPPPLCKGTAKTSALCKYALHILCRNGTLIPAGIFGIYRLKRHVHMDRFCIKSAPDHKNTPLPPLLAGLGIAGNPSSLHCLGLFHPEEKQKNQAFRRERESAVVNRCFS